jgi:hypothetical protein
MKIIGFSGCETPSKQAFPSLGLILKNTFYLKVTKTAEMAKETRKTLKIGKDIARIWQKTIRAIIQTLRALSLITLAA